MGGNIEREPGAGAGPVLDNDLLAPDLRQPVGDDARGQIRAAAGRKPDHQTHDPARPALRLRGPG